MWPFAKQSARRKEIRRSKAERGLTLYARVLARAPWRSGSIALGSAVLAGIIVNLGGDVLDVGVGQLAQRAITSRVDFSVENKKRTAEMRAVARDNADIYFDLDVSLLQDIRGRLTNALKLAQEHAADPNELQQEALKAKLVLHEDGRTELVRIATLTDTEELKQAAARFEKSVEDAVNRLARSSTPLVQAFDPSQRRTPIRAVLVDAREPDVAGTRQQRVVPVATLLYSNRAEAAESVADAAARAFSTPLRASMRDSLLEMLRGPGEGLVKPIYRYSAEESDRAAQEAYDSVPTEYDTYLRGRQLADAGLISEEEYALLQQELSAYQAWVASGGRSLSPTEQAELRANEPGGYERWLTEREEARAAYVAHWLAIAGYGFLAVMITLGLTYHLSQTPRPLHFSPRKQIVAATILLALLAVARLVYVETSGAYYAVGTQALAAALLAIVFAGGPVVALLGSMALLNTLATREGVGFLLVLLSVSMTLRLALHDIRSRGKIVAVGSAATLVAIATTLATGLVDGRGLAFVFWSQALLAGATTLAAAFIIEGTLPGIERLFKVSTNMTLLEWCDASKPLLRMLAAEAPGTYNHSLLVGTLAEAAAEAVGANGLLARTGAYYHDIGKINKPEYFAENQALGASRHDGLSPAMSHLIIIGHVKDGIEMAREYGVPASLHPFIAEHQGTTLVQYFYHAASQRRRPGEPEVSDVQFRYPGPKPQSRETAILMLCDGVEGAVRAMPEPTPGRIEDLVTKIGQHRLMDGQFDECDLTFRELEIIERSLVKSLCAIYHSRIQYPEQRDEHKAEPRAS